MRVLEYLEVAEIDGTAVNRCLRCAHVLGAATVDYKDQAGRYDEPITVGQPAGFDEPSEVQWILRHFICPGCGVLLEVDMLPAGEPSAPGPLLEPRRL